MSAKDKAESPKRGWRVGRKGDEKAGEGGGRRVLQKKSGVDLRKQMHDAKANTKKKWKTKASTCSGLMTREIFLSAVPPSASVALAMRMTVPANDDVGKKQDNEHMVGKAVATRDKQGGSAQVHPQAAVGGANFCSDCRQIDDAANTDKRMPKVTGLACCARRQRADDAIAAGPPE